MMVIRRRHKIFTAAVIVLMFVISACTSSGSGASGGYIEILRSAPKGINYRQVGFVDTHLPKSHFQSMDWWKRQVESRLKKKARELNADALIHLKLDPSSGSASAIAIKYREVFPGEGES